MALNEEEFHRLRGDIIRMQSEIKILFHYRREIIDEIRSTRQEFINEIRTAKKIQFAELVGIILTMAAVLIL
jgi:hypothetical protein